MDNSNIVVTQEDKFKVALALLLEVKRLRAFVMEVEKAREIFDDDAEHIIVKLSNKAYALLHPAEAAAEEAEKAKRKEENERFARALQHLIVRE